MSATARSIRSVVPAIEQAEGQGARVRRSIGTPQLRNLSPFLMLDHFSIKQGAGFPDHPHRGQETITYLLRGSVRHADFQGNEGTIGPGDLQFMTAGRGIVHAEMPGVPPPGVDPKSDEAANVGLQLWVDLPEKLKSCEPRYRDLRATEIPVATADNDKVTVKVISGNSHGIDSVKDLAYTPVWLLDVDVAPGGKLEQPIPEGWTAFVYVLDGADIAIETGEAGSRSAKTVPHYTTVVFNADGAAIRASVDAAAEQHARFVIVAGTPLDQQVVQLGPFVVTSTEAARQAIVDFQTHSNGFERARDWASEIGKELRS